MSDRRLPTQGELIAAIAERCGVSERTVIRVMTGAGPSRSGARERAAAVRAAAEALGYRPNAAAQAIGAGRHGAVALLSPSDLPTHVTAEALAGITDALARSGQRLVLARVPHAHLAGEDGLPGILRHHACDGMLVNSVRSLGRRVDAAIRRYAVPSIHLNYRRGHDSVCHADAQAAAAIVRRLIAQGHRRIGYLRIDVGSQHSSEDDRAAGCADALAQAGLPYDERTIVAELHRDDGGPEPTVEVEALLAAWRPRPTAILAYDGRAADLATLAAARLGWRIPQEVSLAAIVSTDFSVGGHRYGGIRLAEWHLGMTAVEMLMAKIADPGTRLPTRLIEGREVTGNTVAAPSR